MTSYSIFHSASRTSIPVVSVGRHEVVVHEREDAERFITENTGARRCAGSSSPAR